MTININIKADVDNISISQLYGLLQLYQLEKVKDKKVYDFNGFSFQIEMFIDMAINYTITEIR